MRRDGGSVRARRRIEVALLAALAMIVVACGGPPYMPARAQTSLTAATATEGASDMEHREGSFQGVRANKLVEQSWRPRQDARGVLVIVHGLKDHSSRYAEVAEHLVRKGFAVYSFDLRGHGRSEGVRVNVESFDDYIADLDLFVQRVRADQPGKPIFVFGHSMGGAIATLYAIDKKPPVAGLILSGAALKADVSGFAAFGTRMVAAIAPGAGVFNLDLANFSRDPKVVEEGKNDPLVYQDGAPARTARELLGAIDRIQDHMEDVTLPLLILHGGADKVTPPEGSRQLKERARSADKTLVIFDGLYHDLLHEPEKAQVEAQIIGWLEAHTASTAQPTALWR
jgi:acylglycerol lipase